MTKDYVLEILEHNWTCLKNLAYTDNELDDALEYIIKALEQEPQKGHWKRISIDKYSEHAKYWYRCDRCGKDNLGNTDFCPSCGAKMVEQQERSEE